MRLSAAATLPSASRLQELLTAMAWAHDAEKVLSGLDRRSGFTVIGLPIFTRLISDTKQGKREVVARLTWADGAVLAIPTGVIEQPHWSVVEHGRRRRGTCTVSVTSGEILTEGYPSGASHPRLFPAPKPLAQLQRDGAAAEWALLSELEPHVTASLQAANRTVAREIEDNNEDIDLYTDRSNHGAVDTVALEKLAGQLLYGTEGSRDGSIVLRLIRRCAQTAINQQPVASYLAANIFSAAEEAIRREIRDPHIGRKVRRLARKLNASDLETVIRAYRAAHPKDALGRTRAILALTAGKTIDAVSSSLTEQLPVRALVDELGTPDLAGLVASHRQRRADGEVYVDPLTEDQVFDAWTTTAPHRRSAVL